MAKYGSGVVTITLDDAPGGTPRIITPYVRDIGGMKLESITQQSNPFGTTSESHTPTGMDKVADIPLHGFFDDTASVGPEAVFFVAATWALDKAPASVGRLLVVVAATGATFTITMHLISAEVLNKLGTITEYAAVLRQKSTGVWS